MNRRAWVAVVAAVVVMAVGCADPDVAARDRAKEQATSIAEALELPASFKDLGIDDTTDRASTPAEDRGAGQMGKIRRVFDASTMTTSQAFETLEQWLADYTLTTNSGADNRCTDTSLTVAFAKPDHVLVVHVYIGIEGNRSSIAVPYGYTGLDHGDTEGRASRMIIPTCPT